MYRKVFRVIQEEMTQVTDKELIDWAIQNKRVDILVKHKWGFDLSPGQIEIVRKIAFLEKKKISIDRKSVV